jgi:hypothetical protein
VDALLRATTERLVLINTPDQGDRVRFDIRAIQEFFAAEFLYVDTQVDLLRERLELIAGDSHWREVVQFVLGALTALKRATEWTVALDVLRALDAGGRDAVEVALARRLARGALHAALFFDNGAGENNRKTRDQLKPIMDPIAETTDEYLFQVIDRVSAPESRAWIRAWAIEQVRRLQPSQSRGALRILSRCNGELEKRETLEFIDSLPTSQVSDFVAAIDIERRVRHQREAEEVELELEAESLVLERDDCVSAAPYLVSRMFWQASGDVRRSSRGKTLVHQRIQRERPTPTLVALRKMFGVPRTITHPSGVVLEEPRLASNSREVVAGSQRGLLRWLGTC